LEITYDAAKSFAEGAAKPLKIDQSEFTVTFDASKMRAAISKPADDAHAED
jgi:hypothetical protein